MRLIDADALMELARNHVNRTVDCNDIARFPTIDAVPVVRCSECIYFRKEHVLTDDGQRKSYEEFPPEAFDALGTGHVTMSYGINVGSQCLVDCNRGYGEDKTVFRNPNDYCSRGVRKMDEPSP